MPVRVSLAQDLCKLAKEFKSGDPVQAAQIRADFKILSKNDVTRAVVYLMEVIGARDEQFKNMQEENRDLKELLTLKAPGWDKEDEGDEVSAGLQTSGGSEGIMATEGDNSTAQPGGVNVQNNTDSEGVQSSVTA